MYNGLGSLLFFQRRAGLKLALSFRTFCLATPMDSAPVVTDFADSHFSQLLSGFLLCFSNKCQLILISWLFLPHITTIWMLYTESYCQKRGPTHVMKRGPYVLESLISIILIL